MVNFVLKSSVQFTMYIKPIQSFRSDSCLSEVQIVLIIFSTKDKGSGVASIKHIQCPVSK